MLWYARPAGSCVFLTGGGIFVDVAKLRLRIKELRFDGHPPRLPHVQVRLGHRVFVSPKRAVEAPWNDVYDFDLSFHEHLFYTLQVPRVPGPAAARSTNKASSISMIRGRFSRGPTAAERKFGSCD